MFKIFLLSLMVFLFIYSSLRSQPDAISYGCGLTTQVTSSTPYKPTRTPVDGEYLKVLIVYITFADDNYQGYNNFWPPHQKPVSPNGGIPLVCLLKSLPSKRQAGMITKKFLQA